MSVDRPERAWSFRRRPSRDEGSRVSSAVNALGPDGGVEGIEVADDTTPVQEVRVEPDTFDDVFDAHYERLVRALTVVAGDREVAADAVQEAFVKAHLRWNKISRYDDPSGWVRRVAINRLRDEQRRRQRKQRALQRLRSRPATPNELPELDEFGRLLDALPRQQRLATALYYVDSLTVAEIASTLDISEGTVKSHLHDARRRLRPILENEAHHD